MQNNDPELDKTLKFANRCHEKLLPNELSESNN